MVTVWMRRSVFIFPVAVIAAIATIPLRGTPVDGAFWELLAMAAGASSALAWVLYRLLQRGLGVEAVLVSAVLMPLVAHAMLVDLDVALGLPVMHRGIFAMFVPWR